MLDSPLYKTPSPLDIAALRVQQSAGGSASSRVDQSGDAVIIASMRHEGNWRTFNASENHYFPSTGSISSNDLSTDEAIRRKVSLKLLDAILSGYYDNATMVDEAYGIQWDSYTAALFIPCEYGRLGIAYRAAKGGTKDAQEMCKLLAQAVCDRNRNDKILHEQVTKFLCREANAEAKNEQT